MARVIAEEALLLGDPEENKNSLYVGYLEEKKKSQVSNKERTQPTRTEVVSIPVRFDA